MSSENRKTRFARVPIQRGGESTIAGRNQNVKKEKPTRFGASMMESLKKTQMSQDLSTVMTNTNSVIAMELQANGTAQFALRTANGRSIADERDLRAISGLNMAVNEERKLAAKESISKDVVHKCAAIKQVLLEQGHVGPLAKGLAEVVKSTKSIIDVLNDSTTSIQGLVYAQGSKEDVLRNNILEFSARAQTGIGNYLVHRAGLQEHQEANKINHFIREAKCPEYVFKRLTDKSLVKLTADFDIRHVFFPADPTKGFYLTFREIKEQNMNEFCFGLCDAEMVINSMLEYKFLADMLRLDDDGMLDLYDFDDPKALGNKVANIPFYYPAPVEYVDATGSFNFLAKNGKRGLAFRSGNTLSPQDLLRFFGVIAKKISALGMPLIAQWETFNGIVFPGFVFDPTEEGKDFFVQLKAWAILPENAEVRGNLWKIQDAGFNGEDDSTAAAKSLQRFQAVGRAVLSLLGLDQESVHAQTIAKNFGLGKTGSDLVTKVTRVVSAPAGSEPSSSSKGKEVEGKVKEVVKIPLSDIVAMEIMSSKRSNFVLNNMLAKIIGYTVNYTEVLVESILGPEYAALRAKPQDKDNKRAGLVERSMLTTEAARVVSLLKSQRKNTLAERMSSWFRLFLTDQVQASVAGMVGARLDVLFENPVEYTLADYGGLYEPGFIQAGVVAVHEEDDNKTAEVKDDDGYENE